MENYGIDRRPRGSYQVKPYAKFQTLQNGYEYWHDGEAGGTTKDWVLVHRLLAVAEFGFDSVQSDIDVHHKNGVRWDNRPENIGLMSHSKHASYHNNESSNQGGKHA
ncbi:HNH endonuclease [Halorubrum rutilum]|uniref:HNH endonuclease n=1 Tax=Halorubrum rutilum TaxID=1364933 RepID=A0ABD6AGE4_9EURY|nr:HNH endonuclease [Halorubrum rutilum]